MKTESVSYFSNNRINIQAVKLSLKFIHVETKDFLEKMRSYTAKLSQAGDIEMCCKKLRTFLRNTLNFKGTTTENLYLFNTPPIAWKTEFLNQLDIDLNQQIEIYPRYKAISIKLDLITENLALHKDLMQHRHSSFLEWIIIILISTEVVNIFFERFM